MEKVITKKEYLEMQIAQKQSENVASEVEEAAAMRMSLQGQHTQQFEQAAAKFRMKRRANEELIRIYKDFLEKEEKGEVLHKRKPLAKDK